ncbi:helix-turn-helix transcriptional regulator [Cellulosilyticum sp. WCF-2]|nr:helix-turn-helix transcriptional regulator [Cellulosilyticum sp. WCF-2]
MSSLFLKYFLNFEKIQERRNIYLKNATWGTILDKIIKTRESKGLTKSDLARKIDTSLEFVSQMERGKKKPSIETLIKISNELELNFF